MYSLSFLFLALPLYFSHVFMQFGIVIGDGASFERQKMYLFLFCMAVVIIEMLVTRWADTIIRIRSHGLMILGLLLLPLVSVLISGTDIDPYWIRGTYEKFHGYLLYVGVIVLGLSLSLLSL